MTLWARTHVWWPHQRWQYSLTRLVVVFAEFMSNLSRSLVPASVNVRRNIRSIDQFGRMVPRLNYWHTQPSVRTQWTSETHKEWEQTSVVCCTEYFFSYFKAALSRQHYTNCTKNNMYWASDFKGIACRRLWLEGHDKWRMYEYENCINNDNSVDFKIFVILSHFFF